MSKELAKIESFRRELAVAETFEEIKFCESKAAAVAEFAKKQGIGKEGQDKIGEFRVEVEQNKGAWLEKNFPRGRPEKRSNISTFSMKDEGITKDESSDARLLFTEDRATKEIIDELKSDPEVIVTPRSVARAVRKKKKEERINAEKNTRVSDIKDIEIRHGDFVEVLKDVKNIDAIITDPPYPLEFISEFSKLSKFASTNLKEDGFIAVYSGQYHLPEVIHRLSEHLAYVWTFCLYHVGKKQLVNGVNIMCGWKPVLIFSNGKKKMRYSAYDVLISESMEKHSHEWQQSESGVKGLIEVFTKPGELVVDPFAGSGTFLKVAKDMDRNGIGAEIEKQK